MSKRPDVRINQNLIEFFEEEISHYSDEQTPTLSFTVPLYQREYAWGVEEKKLFCDTLKSDKSCEFLGTIILQRSDNPFIFEIIDGQQLMVLAKGEILDRLQKPRYLDTLCHMHRLRNHPKVQKKRYL